MNSNQSTKTFKLRDVLTLSTGRALSVDKDENTSMDPLYDILEHVTGIRPTTISLGESARSVRPDIFAAFPELKAVNQHLYELDMMVMQGKNMGISSVVSGNAWVKRCEDEWEMKESYDISPGLTKRLNESEPELSM